MPELPEVETVRRGLSKGIKGKAIEKVRLQRADLRFPFPKGFAESLAGKRIIDITRRAKYLQIELSGKQVLLAHLGMSGRFSVLKEVPKKLGKHDHVVMQFTDGTALIFNDPRRFGMMDLVAVDKLASHKLLKHLGPEPLEKTFSAAYLKEALRKRKTSIKQALMDQEVVVGVGNIYASEALFLSAVHPATPAHKTAAKAGEMVTAIQQVLNRALKSGGSSLKDFFDADGNAGYFQHNFTVYDREDEACSRCKGTIKRVVQGGRSTFFCAECQK